MGIYIEGMEMPKNCEECPLSLYQHSPCWENGGAVDWENRPNWCPLIELPPHGRLIDADAARKTIKPWSPEDERSGCTFDTVKKLMYTMLDRAPTIIPAEEDER